MLCLGGGDDEVICDLLKRFAYKNQLTKPQDRIASKIFMSPRAYHMHSEVTATALEEHNVLAWIFYFILFIQTAMMCDLVCSTKPDVLMLSHGIQHFVIDITQTPSFFSYLWYFFPIQQDDFSYHVTSALITYTHSHT
jgi:hypothetical protein